MSESPDTALIEPVCAATILELEGGPLRLAPQVPTSPLGRTAGIRINGLDSRFGGLWKGGRVIGIGAASSVQDVRGPEKVK